MTWHSRARADAGLPARSPGPAYPPCSLCQGSTSYIPFLRDRQRAKLFSFFWRKIATISDRTELTRNQFITSEKRVSQRTPLSSPLQAVGPTLDFYKQFSATPHRVTGGKDGSLVLLLSMLCMVTNVHCSELHHKLLQSQDMHGPCVIGQKCSGSMVSEYHWASTC